VTPEAGSLAVLGNVNADIVARPVSDLPPPGGDMLVDTVELRVGGAAANAALALAALGCRPRLAGCVGDDPLGAFVLERLRDRGLAEEVRVLPGVPTGVSICLEGPGRDRTFVSMRGALDRFDASMVPHGLMESPFVLFCGYFTLGALRGGPALELLERSRAAGATVLFDPDVEAGGWSDGARREVAEVLPLVDGFLPNEHEACGLTDAADPVEAGRELQRVGGGRVVVKLGADGAVVIETDGSARRVAAPAVVARDTTGVGDAFDAGLLYGLAQGWTWDAAVSFAVRLGSTVAARPTADRHPSLGEVVGG
jgi:sugar/nucleoside kinase (ribokinase family)